MAHNPPAFPVAPILPDVREGSDGMTLRDYFAAHAPTATDDHLSHHRAMDRSRNPHNEPHRPPLRTDIQIRAQLAYDYADAMLAQRNPTP